MAGNVGRRTLQQKRNALAVLLAATALAQAALTWRFFFSPSGTLGHDWSYFLPQLAAGDTWFRTNGLLAIPWFSPHACGGLPLLANPQSVVWSVPQLLFALLPPALCAAATLWLFAVLGAAATYRLVRRCFAGSPEAAALAAGLFLCNGFLIYRLAIGHLTYHVAGLVPLAAVIVLADGRRLARVGGLGLVVGYFVFAGAANYLGVLVLALLGLALLQRLTLDRWAPGLATVLAGGVALGLAIGAVKLAPAWVFLQSFPRTGEPMALVNNPAALLGRMVISLFLPNLLDLVPDSPFEFECGVSLAPPVLIYAALRRRRLALSRPLAALILLLLVPVALSTGGEAWGRFLKTLPYVKHMVIPTRWWSLYVFLLLPGAAIAFDRLVPPGRRPAWLALILLAVVVQSGLRDGRFYRGVLPADPANLIERPFDPAAIAAASRPLPPIRRLASANPWRNDSLVDGVSPLPCYEPIFGYGGEMFPARRLVPGEALAADPDGYLNLANPACYIWGAANRCRPGDRFAENDVEAARRFLSYRPFPVIVPPWQSAAGILSGAAFAFAWFAGFAIGNRRAMPLFGHNPPPS